MSNVSVGRYFIDCRGKYFIDFTEQQNKFCLSLQYNRVNSFLFVNCIEIYKFKAKECEINTTILCLGNVSKDFPTDNKKAGLCHMDMSMIF